MSQFFDQSSNTIQINKRKRENEIKVTKSSLNLAIITFSSFESGEWKNLYFLNMNGSFLQ